MEDKKNFNGQENTEELNKELENIAEIFRQQLAETTEQYEKGEINISADLTNQEENLSSASIEENLEPAEEFFCEECGESYTIGKEGLCENCLEEMRGAPLKFRYIIMALLIGVSAFFPMRSFWENVEGYASAYEAKANGARGKLTSALTAYDDAIAFFEGKEINAKSLYFESAEIVFKEMSSGSASMSDVASRVSKGLESSFVVMPTYKKYEKMGDESLVMYATMQKFYDVVNKAEYATYTIDNENMYNSIMAEIESLIGTTVEIESVKGEVLNEPVNEAMVRFCQYMFAYTSEKQESASKYLEMVYELKPEYLWLYAYELSLASIKNGDIKTAEKLAEELVKTNAEDADGYNLFSIISRISDDGKKALEWAEKGLEKNPQNAELLRQKAMAYAVCGDFDNAKLAVDEALSYESYGLLYYTSIVIENELGNTQTVEETVSLLETYGVGVSEKVRNYLDGNITAEQLFTEGTGEVE